MLAALCVMLALGVASCTNLDCPLDNVVHMMAGFYDSETKAAVSPSDTLSITPLRRDTTLLNRQTDAQSFLLPLNETAGVDTLLLRLSNAAGQAAVDTLIIGHTPRAHFESVDCPASVFHTLTSASVISHEADVMPLVIDSVTIVRTTVNYDDVENLRIFVRTAAQ